MQCQWFYMVVVIGGRMDRGIQGAYLCDSKRCGPWSAGIATGACSHSFKIVLGRQRASKILLVTNRIEKAPCKIRVNSVFSFPIICLIPISCTRRKYFDKRRIVYEIAERQRFKAFKLDSIRVKYKALSFFCLTDTQKKKADLSYLKVEWDNKNSFFLLQTFAETRWHA